MKNRFLINYYYCIFPCSVIPIPHSFFTAPVDHVVRPMFSLYYPWNPYINNNHAPIPPPNTVNIHRLFEKGSGERRIKWPFGLDCIEKGGLKGFSTGSFTRQTSVPNMALYLCGKFYCTPPSSPKRQLSEQFEFCIILLHSIQQGPFLLLLHHSFIM